MRQIARSSSIIGVLIGLYVCASLAAIPVPRFVASAFVPSEPGVVCKCGEASACAMSDECCCAAKAHAEHNQAQANDDEPMLLTFGCTPDLKWFLAAVPVFDGAAVVIGIAEGSPFGRLGLDDAARADSRGLDVQSPPPKRLV